MTLLIFNKARYHFFYSKESSSGRKLDEEFQFTLLQIFVFYYEAHWHFWKVKFTHLILKHSLTECHVLAQHEWVLMVGAWTLISYITSDVTLLYKVLCHSLRVIRVQPFVRPLLLDMVSMTRHTTSTCSFMFIILNNYSMLYC